MPSPGRQRTSQGGYLLRIYQVPGHVLEPLLIEIKQYQGPPLSKLTVLLEADNQHKKQRLPVFLFISWVPAMCCLVNFT